jgi:ubiquitin-activating enzyme E1 C
VGFAPLLPSERAEHLLLSRGTPYPNEAGPLACTEFVPGAAAAELAAKRVLVIGAGGLGCDVLKSLALSGVKRIDVVDMDTIDLSNLNRQFLFRLADVGKGKAEAAARFVMARVPGVTITPHTWAVQAIEAKVPGFRFLDFDLVIGALDNLDARRWMSTKLVALAGEDMGDERKIIPYVDGGSEVLSGNVKVIIPTVTPCFECLVDTFTPQVVFQMCTVADKPRRPEHCVAWALQVWWPATHADRACDKDNRKDMEELVAAAQERAKTYNIEGVTFSFAVGVAKGVVPAIAATNGLTAAACCFEALKLLTGASHTMNNALQCVNEEGQVWQVIANQKRADCAACSEQKIFAVKCAPERTLGHLLRVLRDDEKTQMRDPVVMNGAQCLFKAGDARYEANMEKTMRELCSALLFL